MRLPEKIEKPCYVALCMVKEFIQACASPAILGFAFHKVKYIFASKALGK